jgi:hypothetical protein
VLFNIRVRVAEMKSTSFKMFADISHSDLPDLKKRVKTDTVLSTKIGEIEERGRTEPMYECIERFREKYAEDMEIRCCLATATRCDVVKLPSDIAVACLLHPLYGGKLFCLFFYSLVSLCN